MFNFFLYDNRLFPPLIVTPDFGFFRFQELKLCDVEFLFRCNRNLGRFLFRFLLDEPINTDPTEGVNQTCQNKK
jgi:hypothetical protein